MKTEQKLIEELEKIQNLKILKWKELLELLLEEKKEIKEWEKKVENLIDQGITLNHAYKILQKEKENK